jgi:hypothetical protein
LNCSAAAVTESDCFDIYIRDKNISQHDYIKTGLIKFEATNRRHKTQEDQPHKSNGPRPDLSFEGGVLVLIED